MTNGNQYSACRPPKKSTYLTIGQDLFSISEYALAQYNTSLHDGSNAPLFAFSPAAAMVYTDIQTLRGLNKPADYGSGVEYADGILDSLFPGEQVGLQIGLWLNGTQGCEQINQGLLNSNIKKLTKYFKRCSASKVFLRIGYEFDNPSFGYHDAQAYVDAYRKIAKACKNQCREKVLLVWHSWAAPEAKGVELADFYPGDDVVDWVGVSIFQQFYPWSNGNGQLSDLERVLDFAGDHGKPTMIAESTPFGGIDMTGKEVRRHNLTDPWTRWFQPTLDLIDRYDISMWSYINCAWDSQPMWKNSGFGETRLSTNADLMKKWRKFVLGESHRTFLGAGSLVDCGKKRNGLFRSVAFGQPRDLVAPMSGRSEKYDMWTDYRMLFVPLLGLVLVALVVWRRHRINRSSEELTKLKSDGFGYGAIDFNSQSLEGLPSTIPTHSIRVRVRGGVVWRDPLLDE